MTRRILSFLAALTLAAAMLTGPAQAADPQTVVNHPASTRPDYRPMVQSYSRNDNPISVYGKPGCVNFIDKLTPGRNVIGASWKTPHWTYGWAQEDARDFDGSPRYDSWDLYTEIPPDQCVDTRNVLRWFVVTRRA